MYRRILCALGACASLGLGCYGEADVPGADVSVTSAPVAYDTYPSYVYGGRPHYFYRDHWYYREGNRWRYYRHEPRELYEHRRRFHIGI